VNECVRLDDIELLQQTYRRVLEILLGN
jgi:acetylornithine deacetylase/succinyl-diaminopimelate desuccinylase-like protein